MKKSNAYLPGLLLAGSAMFASCSKNNILVPEEEVAVENAAAKKGDCIATGFNVAYGDGKHMIFKTEFNSSKSARINAGVYQGGSATNSLLLDVNRSGKTITITKAGSPTDVVLIVTLNSSKKAVKVVVGNTPDHNFLPTDFEYRNGKLSSMKILLAGKYLTSNFNYKDGNISSIEDEAVPGGLIPGKVTYEYNTNVRAAKQMYLEETRKFSWNTFTLLQYLGLFPELDPIHLRTRTKVLWENNYQAMDAMLTNHQVENGKLVRYDLTYPGSDVSIPHYIDWQCSLKNNDDDNDGAD